MTTFFNQVLEEVKKVNVSDIIEQYADVKRNTYTDDDSICPFHDDAEFGNFKISDNKGIYKCFSCGAFGNGITYVKELKHIGFKEAVLEIAYHHDIISRQEAESFLKDKKFMGNVKRVQQVKPKETDKLVKKAENDILDKAFSAFQKVSCLSDEHKKTLLERGFEVSQMSDFFTFPEATSDFLQRFYNELGKENVGLLKNVPGFVTADYLKQVKGNEVRYAYTFKTAKGIAIPVRNGRGQMVGIQIRRDNVEGKQQRYIWFSSTYAEKHKSYKHGTSAGSPIHVEYPEENKYAKTLFITEGIFKAKAIANTFKTTCASLQGVGNYKAIDKELVAIMEKQGPIQNIIIAFDADVAQNVNVYLHMRGMVQLIKSLYPDIRFYTALWDEKDGKGLDDLIANHKINTLTRMNTNEFIARYDKLIENMVKETKKPIQKAPKELIEEYFEKIVLRK